MNWQELEKKYKIKFILNDGTFRPVNEWLDDLYLLYTPEQVREILFDMMENADEVLCNVLMRKE